MIIDRDMLCIFCDADVAAVVVAVVNDAVELPQTLRLESGRVRPSHGKVCQLGGKDLMGRFLCLDGDIFMSVSVNIVGIGGGWSHGG